MTIGSQLALLYDKEIMTMLKKATMICNHDKSISEKIVNTDHIEHIINFLLENSGPSIIYRVKKEVLKSPLSSSNCYLQAILDEKDVASIINNRQTDGWLGSYFHTRFQGAEPFEVFEVALRYLAEKGLDLSHSIFDYAANAYQNRNINDPIYEGSGSFGYDYTCMGLWLIRSSGIARIGYENKIDISKDIDLSLKSFENVLHYKSILDIVLKNSKGNYYFKESVLWPCIYNLKILAFTQNWRTEKNIKILAESVDKLLPPDTFGAPVYTMMIKNSKKYYASPCDAFTHNLIEPLDSDKGIGSWLEKMELFARCGIVKYSSKLKSEIEKLYAFISESGICNISINEYYFKNWSAYSGLKIEESWKNKTKKQCDISFRVLLILHYSRL